MKQHIKTFLLSFVLIFLVGPAASMAFMVDLTTPNSDSGMPLMTYGTVTGVVDGSDSSIFHFTFELDPNLSTTLNGGANFGIDKVAFNTDLSLTDGMFVNFNPTTWNISYDKNADGFGLFSALLTDPGDRISSLSFDIDYTGPLSEDDFLFASTGAGASGSGMFAMHIGGFGYGQGSVWVRDGETPPVPEPATMVLMGVSLLSVAGYMRKITRRSK
jgi:hypothetical protein